MRPSFLTILAFSAVLAATATASAAEPELLGEDSQSSTGAVGQAGVQLAAVTQSEGGGSTFNPLGFLQSARRAVAGNDVTLSETQRRRLEGMRPVLTELAGPEGVFSYEDLPDVTSSLSGELGSRVRGEISKRAQKEANKGMIPAVRGLLVQGHVKRNYCNYFSQGMGQANGMVNSGLGEFLDGVGVERPRQQSANPYTRRNLTLAGLEDFRAGAETLREIDQQRNAPVRVVFPRGFAVRDLDSILENPNRIPPGGSVRVRERKNEN